MGVCSLVVSCVRGWCESAFGPTWRSLSKTYDLTECNESDGTRDGTQCVERRRNVQRNAIRRNKVYMHLQIIGPSDIWAKQASSLGIAFVRFSSSLTSSISSSLHHTTRPPSFPRYRLLISLALPSPLPGQNKLHPNTPTTNPTMPIPTPAPLIAALSPPKGESPPVFPGRPCSVHWSYAA